MIDELLKKIDDSYTLQKLDEMIRINSVVGNEEELANYIQMELSAIGLKPELHEVESKRMNIYAKIKGEAKGKRLMFNGHLDTVPVVVGWDTDPFTPVRKNDLLYGLGSCDMKSGIACIITTLKAIIESDYNFNGELSFSGVVDEEAYSKGARALLKTDLCKVNAIILAEPYPGDDTKPIPLGITGKVLYDIYVHGKAAHAFRPHFGINAVEDAAKIVSNLERLNFLNHPEFKKGNYSTIKFEGGYNVYSVIVPAEARFEVNRLMVPGETVKSSIADMERLVNELDLKSNVEVKTKPPQYEAYSMSREDPIMKAFEPVYIEVMGKVPLYEYAYGVTDANVFAGEGGIPCLHLGPQRGVSTPNGGGTHEKNEYVRVSWLPKICRMYAMITDRFLNL